MNEVRFVTIFAVSIAGWIVIMWLTLSALNAAEQNNGAGADKSPAPAANVDAPAKPSAGAEHHGAGLTSCAPFNTANPCAGAGEVA